MSNIIIQSRKCSDCGFIPAYIRSNSRCWSYGLCGSCFIGSSVYISEYYHKNKDRIKAYQTTWKWSQKNRVREWSRNVLHLHRLKGCDIHITIEELVNLVNTTTHCRYCKNVLCSYEKGSVSLDRIDNELMLTKDNIQIICRLCNTTKGPRTHEEFIEYCKFVGTTYA